jgi:hypothetical protein
MSYNAAMKAAQIPPRMRMLPISPEGYPVPWFVHWNDGGTPDFRVVGRDKLTDAVKHKKCWVCGQPLGRMLAFVIGPMCAINRTISEPPSHRDCAIFSAMACPFLSNPRMRRNDSDFEQPTIKAAGNGIMRNPGVACVWVSRGYKLMKVNDGVLFRLEYPLETLWFAHGREATWDEVNNSIKSGLPLLLGEARREGPHAVAALVDMTREAMELLPARNFNDMLASPTEQPLHQAS